MGTCDKCVCVYVFLSAAETAMKARREIADYMKSGRIERARIRVSMYMCSLALLCTGPCMWKSRALVKTI